MFSQGKFASLDSTSRLRKLGRLIDKFFNEKNKATRLELESFLGHFANFEHEYPDIFSRIVMAKDLEERALHRLAMAIDEKIGVERADWDFRPTSQEARPIRNGSWVYCEDIRSPFNIGSIFRTAEAFGFEGLGLSPVCASPHSSDRVRRASMGTSDYLCWIQADFESFRSQVGDLPVFALELGGADLRGFDFPKNGIVVLGSEELGVSAGLLETAKKSHGIASIELGGQKASLNVGVSFGILAQEWTTRAPSFPA